MPRSAASSTRRLALKGRISFCCEPLEPRHLLSAAPLLITEFVATNVSTLLSGDSQYDDWIEIQNQGSTTVNLSGYYLTDNLGDLTKWAFPTTTISAGAYQVVFASAPLDANGNPIGNYVDSAGRLHASFKLDSQGEALALTYRDPGTGVVSIVHQYAPEFREQFPDVSYGVASDSQLRYFQTPTPGAPNGAGLLGVVEDTSFSVDRGFFDAPFVVEITSATPGAQIYYTTDGSAPTASAGVLYTGAVAVDHTTVLRAIAIKPGYVSTNVDTQTYLFLNDVIRQSQQSALDDGYPSVWSAENGNFTADYGFDAEVVGTFDANGNPQGDDNYNGAYASQLKEALLAIPTISIVLDPDDMFANGPQSSRGIYIDPRKGRNLNPERATSVEWVTPNGTSQLQVDAGIQIQGGAFRSQSLTRKHSFRLVFKDEYGPSELSTPLFGAAAADQFNTVVLKAAANDGYSWRGAQPSVGPSTLQYARDQFGHSLQLAMGHASSHDAYAHLYINGMYWGLYSTQERPDADFAASYLGANPDTWDGLTAPDDDKKPPEVDSGNLDAWYAMLAKTAQAGTSVAAYMELQGRRPDGTTNPAVAPLLDVDNYIDYLIVNVWGGNDDWPHHNWWAGRDRNPDTTEGFQFFLWDYDGVMGNSRGWSPLDTKTFDQNFTSTADNNVGEAHFNLRNNPEYRLAFADRVQKWFFNEGLLTPDSLIARYQQIADEVELLMVAESARWGDMNTPTPTPLTPAEWATERDWLLNTYLPDRSQIVMQEMREYGLYPATDAPVYSQHGGYVPSGFGLTMSPAPAGAVIYYTLDDSDPRLVGGAVSGTAAAYNGQPVEIVGAVTVKARALQNGVWSALNEAEFSTTPLGNVAKLRITELQYHPTDFAGVVDDEDLEYIEVLNTDTTAVSLDGVQIAGFATTPHVFDDGLTLGPGERIVVPRNIAAFQSVYGSSINLTPTGYTDRNLSNGGETVTLLGPSGQVLQSFTYGDGSPWPDAPDGDGPSLEIIDPLGDASDPNNWRASLYFFGSPGVEGLPLVGDYDLSGAVDAADYDAWRAAFGSVAAAAGSGADGNRDGLIDAADYTVWRDHQGDSTTLYGTQASALQAALSMDHAIGPTTTGASFETQGAATVEEVARTEAFATLSRSAPSEGSRTTSPRLVFSAPERFAFRKQLLLLPPFSPTPMPSVEQAVIDVEVEEEGGDTDAERSGKIQGCVVPPATRLR